MPLRSGVLRRAAVAAAIGIGIGFAVLVTTSTDLTTVRGGRIGGDFPAFYGAGRLAQSRDAHRLYDADAQRAIQQDLLPPATNGWIHFAYPPFVALAYVPFTLLGFKAAYVLHTLLMALCVVAALQLARPSLPVLGSETLPAAAALLAFYPLFRAVAGGQNTAVSLLCAAGAAGALAARRDVRAGLWLGAWLFKPQLSLPVCALLALNSPNGPRRYRLLAGAASVAGLYYVAGALVWGANWPAWWVREGVLPFAAADRIVDRGNGISFPDVAADLGVPAAGLVCAGLLGGLALWLAWRRSSESAAFVGATVAAAVLAAPHALYYDGGLMALALVASAALRPATLPAVVALWLLGWTQPLRPYLPVPPVTLGLVLSLYLAVRADGRTWRFGRSGDGAISAAGPRP